MSFLFEFIRGFYVVFKKSFQKKATLKYPQQKNIKDQNFRGSHIFKPELCIACKCCAKSCPNNCITITQNEFIINYQKCCFCGNCTRSCPRKAIMMDSFEIEPSLKKDSLSVNLMSKS